MNTKPYMKKLMLQSQITILVADDDEDDRLLIKEAFEENNFTNQIRYVTDGQELMDYLERREPYTQAENSPRPGVILLDLNMPKKDGWTALKEIKQNPYLKDIPVIIFTTSQSEEDIVRSYNLGVNSFISKPVKFDQFVEAISNIVNYWIGMVELPPTP